MPDELVKCENAGGLIEICFFIQRLAGFDIRSLQIATVFRQQEFRRHSPRFRKPFEEQAAFRSRANMRKWQIFWKCGRESSSCPGQLFLVGSLTLSF